MRDFFADSKTYRELHTIMQQSTEPPSVKEQTGRTVRIFDAHYEAAVVDCDTTPIGEMVVFGSNLSSVGRRGIIHPLLVSSLNMWSTNIL
jgi:hypothetical protein